MSTFLVLESGATKLQWFWVSDNEYLAQGQVPGLHPFLNNADQWRIHLDVILDELDCSTLQAVYYYGTGCGTVKGRTQVTTFLSQKVPFPHIDIQVATDLLAAARSLCQKEYGLLGILGTGSNVAWYDGENIIHQAGGIGYILGDEGGGAALGKHLLQAVLKHQLPLDLLLVLQQTFDVSPSVVIPAVYHSSAPSRYLASFAPWLKEQVDHPFIRHLIYQSFTAYLEVYVLPLAQRTSCYTIHFTGSISTAFADILHTCCKEHQLNIAQIVADPSIGLVRFHQKT